MMIRFLVRKCIPGYQDTQNPAVRKRYGILGGILGIICNTVLFLIKLLIGTAIHSIAVISDGFNNLSDMGSSAASIAGAVLGSRTPDFEHPYGHGRAEYIAALAVSFLILVFGVELGKNSVMQIISPKPVVFHWAAFVLLMVSVAVKLWMWGYNRYLGKQIQSDVLYAAAKDSLMDAIATTAVTVSAVAAPFVSFPLDGIVGVAVSVLILWTGFSVAKEVIGKLLGKASEPELRKKITGILFGRKEILGIHELLIHDYGPGRLIASVHAEVSAKLSLVEAHDIIDNLEKQVLGECNVDLVIHMDPVEDNEAMKE